jgi:hypothetical protein
MMFEIIIVAIMKLCLFNSSDNKDKLFANVHFLWKNKKQHKHSRCLNMLKLKHNIKLLEYMNTTK